MLFSSLISLGTASGVGLPTDFVWSISWGLSRKRQRGLVRKDRVSTKAIFFHSLHLDLLAGNWCIFLGMSACLQHVCLYKSFTVFIYMYISISIFVSTIRQSCFSHQPNFAWLLYHITSLMKHAHKKYIGKWELHLRMSFAGALFGSKKDKSLWKHPGCQRCTFHSRQIDLLGEIWVFSQTEIYYLNTGLEYLASSILKTSHFWSEMLRVRRSHHQLHVESLWTTWTLWKLAQDTWQKVFPAGMMTGFLVKCELSTFPLLILYDNTAEGNAWNIINWMEWHVFFLRFFVSETWT